MEWNRAISEQRAALMRIGALLHALADLALLAAGRSPAVRGFLLWLLRYAEAVASDFVGGEPATVAEAILPCGNAPCDAIRLAVRLRALARQIEAQARHILPVCRSGCREANPRMHFPIATATEHLHVLSALALGLVRPLRPPDTS